MSPNDHALFQNGRSFTVFVDRAKEVLIGTSENRDEAQILEEQKNPIKIS